MFGKFQSAKWVGCMTTGSLTGVRDLCCSICSSPKNMHLKNEKFTVREMVAGQRKYGVIDKVWGQDDWIFASFFVCVFMDWDRVEVHKHAKKERGQYPANLTEQAWSIKNSEKFFLG